jgi:hypothetical protein
MNDTRRYAYILILIGAVAAAWAALLPHYEAGFHLRVSILFGLLLPFVAYGSLIESLRPGWLLAIGLVITAVMVAAVVAQRGMAKEPAGELSAYALPLVVCAIVLPVAYFLGRCHTP